MINGIQPRFVGHIIRKAIETIHRLAKAVGSPIFRTKVWIEDNPIFIQQ
jgi:hypothetical protein